MAANIRIDQPTGAGTGTGGNARDDIWESQQIELLDVGAGAGTVSWTLDYASPGSPAVLGSSTSNPATISNPRIGDTYKITLVKNGGLDPTDIQTRVIRVTRNSTGVVIDWALNLPALGEEAVHSTGLSSPSGWHTLWYTVQALLRALAMGTTWDLVLPSGDATGVADRTKIQALLTRGRVANLVSGAVYYIDQPLIGVSNTGIVCDGPLKASITQGSAWSGTGASSLTNAMIRLVEVESADPATTPSTAKTKIGSPTLVVTSPTGFAAGIYFKSTGISGANDYAGQSAGALCPADELLRVGSIAGNTITHALKQNTHIGVNNALAPFKTLKQLTSVVDGFELRNIRFDAYRNIANPIVACGVVATFARRIIFTNCAFKGFTYAGFYARGSRDINGDIEFLGALNARVYLFSCQDVALELNDRNEVFERRNSRGSAAAGYAWVVRSQSYNVRLRGTINHAVGGARIWGGVLCRVDATISDVDFTELHTAPLVDDANIGRRGYVLDNGGNDVAAAEWGRANVYNIMWSQCHSGTGKFPTSLSDNILYWYGAIYPHDVFDGEWNLLNSDFSSDPETTTQWRQVGVVSQDVSGRINANIRGFVKGIVCNGTFNLYKGSRLHYDAAAGDGATGLSLTGREAAIVLNEGSGGVPQFEYVRCHRTYHAVEFYAFSYPLNAYKNPLIRVLDGAVIYDSGVYEARDVMIGRMPDSSAYAGIMRAHPIDDASAVDSQIRVTAATAATPTTGTFVTLTMNHTSAGVQRPLIGVLGGPTAVTPIFIAASQTIGARGYVQCDASGFAVVATNGADDLATLTRIVGRARYKRVNGGSPLFMQLG